jgi:NitT/TauT family transport system substrate-binding protein
VPNDQKGSVMTPKHLIRISLAAAVGGLVLVACGSSGGGTATPTTAATANSSTAATAKPGTAATSASAQTLRVNVACTTSFSNVPIEHARTSGVAAKDGIDIQCAPAVAGPQVAAAMLRGDINIAGFTPANVFPLLDAGTAVVGFQPVIDRESFDIVVRKDFALPDQSAGWQGVMKDLQKARIGVVARGAAAENIARGLFTEAGLSPDNAVYIATGLPAPTLAAMTKGEIDAAITFEPAITEALQQGIGVQPFSIEDLTGPAVMNWGGYFWGATSAYAKANPETLKRFQQAYLDGLKWTTDAANHDQVVALTAKFLSLDPTVAKSLVDRNLPYFSKATTLTADRYDKVGDFFNKMGAAKKAYHVSDYAIDLSSQ